MSWVISLWAGLAVLGFAMVFSVPRRTLPGIVALAIGAHLVRTLGLDLGAALPLASLVPRCWWGSPRPSWLPGPTRRHPIYAFAPVIPLIPGTYMFDALTGVLELSARSSRPTASAIVDAAVVTGSIATLTVIALAVGDDQPDAAGRAAPRPAGVRPGPSRGRAPPTAWAAGPGRSRAAIRVRRRSGQDAPRPGSRQCGRPAPGAPGGRPCPSGTAGPAGRPRAQRTVLLVTRIADQAADDGTRGQRDVLPAHAVVADVEVLELVGAALGHLRGVHPVLELGDGADQPLTGAHRGRPRSRRAYARERSRTCWH